MIKWSLENDCVGCPQGCIHCGRKNDYAVLEDLICDECSESCDTLYEYNGNQVCLECLPKVIGADVINEDNYAEFITGIDEEDY